MSRKAVNGIFRPWRRHPKTGQILWARNYGLRAWFIPINELDRDSDKDKK